MAHILVVDDMPHMTAIIGGWLTRNGHDVMRATDGAQALEYLQQHNFDVLITDIDMPRLDGLSLARKLAPSHSLRAVFVITGRTDLDELGLDDLKNHVQFIPKPFSPNRLIQEIHVALGRDQLVVADR